jgi:Leu/Phe-tRNA-protein transferase
MYGVLVGGVFGIMSMFHTENYAGTIALAALVDEVASRTWLRAIDCGPIKPHFQGYGAFPVTNSWMAEFIFRGVPYTTVDDGLI